MIISNYCLGLSQTFYLFSMHILSFSDPAKKTRKRALSSIYSSSSRSSAWRNGPASTSSRGSWTNHFSSLSSRLEGSRSQPHPLPGLAPSDWSSLRSSGFHQSLQLVLDELISRSTTTTSSCSSSQTILWKGR
jgi:hypothetical protein